MCFILLLIPAVTRLNDTSFDGPVAVILVISLLGLCFVILLPGAIYGYVRIGTTVLSQREEQFFRARKLAEDPPHYTSTLH